MDGEYISEFYDVENCNDNFVLSLDVDRLLFVMNDIYSDYILIRVTKPRHIYLLNEDETIGRGTFRGIARWDMTDEEFKWMENRDYDLARYNANYRSKYLKE